MEMHGRNCPEGLGHYLGPLGDNAWLLRVTSPAKTPESRWYTYAIFVTRRTGSTQRPVLDPE